MVGVVMAVIVFGARGHGGGGGGGILRFLSGGAALACCYCRMVLLCVCVLVGSCRGVRCLAAVYIILQAWLL